MPRIQEELNKRSRKLLKPRELPTWWGGFAGILIGVVVLYAAWNLISGSGGVPADPVVPPGTTRPIATNPTSPTSSQMSTSPAGTTETSSAPSNPPSTVAPSDTVEVSTYSMTKVSVPRGAYEAAVAVAVGATGKVEDVKLRTQDGSGLILDVTVDPDGSGPVQAGVVAVRVEDSSGTWSARRA